MDAGEQARPCGLQHIVGVGGSQAEAASDAAQWPLQAPDQSGPCGAIAGCSGARQLRERGAAARRSLRPGGGEGTQVPPRRTGGFHKDSYPPSPLGRPRTQTSRPSLPKELCDELDPVDTWRDALAAAGDD